MEHIKFFHLDQHYKTEEIKLFLHYIGIPFEDITVNERNLSELRAISNYQLIEPPCLLYKGKVLTQFRSIMRYLSIEFDLYPENIYVSTVIEEICNLKDNIAREIYYMYTKHPARIDFYFSESFPKHLSLLELRFSELKAKYNEVSMADFAVFEFLYDYLLSPLKSEKFKHYCEGYSALIRHLEPLFSNSKIQSYFSYRISKDY